MNLGYAITLPKDETVNIKTGGGGVTETMAVSGFDSDPATPGTLDGYGKQTLFVWARLSQR